MIGIHYILYGFAFLFLEVAAEPPKSSIFDKFHQSDFKVKFEHANVEQYNKSVVKEFKIATFKYNRTYPAANGTFELKTDLNNEVEVIIQAYKFASNEYRLFPLRFQVNACLAISRNIIGIGALTKCGNFSGCPIKKNIKMHFCYWHPDESKFPPFIPSGSYLLDMQFMHRSTEIALIKGYGEVYRPILIPDK